MAETVDVRIVLLDDHVDTATSSDMAADSEAEMIAMLERYGSVSSVSNV